MENKLWLLVGFGAVIGLTIGIILGIIGDAPLAPEIGVVSGAGIGLILARGSSPRP